jgi:hypothetical protein
VKHTYVYKKVIYSHNTCPPKVPELTSFTGQWLRLSLSMGPNRVGVSHPITWGQKQIVSETLCSLEYRMMDKVQKCNNPKSMSSLDLLVQLCKLTVLISTVDKWCLNFNRRVNNSLHTSINCSDVCVSYKTKLGTEWRWLINLLAYHKPLSMQNTYIKFIKIICYPIYKLCSAFFWPVMAMAIKVRQWIKFRLWPSSLKEILEPTGQCNICSTKLKCLLILSCDAFINMMHVNKIEYRT